MHPRLHRQEIHATRTFLHMSRYTTGTLSLSPPSCLVLLSKQNTSTCHSPKAYGRLKYALPLPKSDCMLYKIEFGWASMLQVLQGDRSWTPDSMYPLALSE